MTIRNARLVLPEGIVRGELAIEEWRICEIAVSGLPKAGHEIDAEDKILMPGVVDTHAHLYDPHHLHREDFRNGGRGGRCWGRHLRDHDAVRYINVNTRGDEENYRGRE